MPSFSADLSHIKAWVFDLDNTLYGPEAGLWEQISDRMTTYVAHLYGMDALSARALQKHYYRLYGTTLRGLMDVDQICPHRFMDFVHDIDHSHLRPQDALREALSRLPAPIHILTNGSSRHAERVLTALHLMPFVASIADVVEADFLPKPHPRAYEKLVTRLGIDPTEIIFFDDLEPNLRVPHAMGISTVLVGHRTPATKREDWEKPTGKPLPHVDYQTHDLADFLLKAIVAKPEAG